MEIAACENNGGVIMAEDSLPDDKDFLPETKRVDMRELQHAYETVKTNLGKRRIELIECPSTCPKFAERDGCTVDTCVILQEMLDDAEEEILLKAFEKVDDPNSVPETVDRGLRGNVRQQSLTFSRDEIRYNFKGDKARTYKLVYIKNELDMLTADELRKIANRMGYKPTKLIKRGLVELILRGQTPNCKVSIYGERGQTLRLLVSIEFRWGFNEHLPRHGFPLAIKLDAGRRICVKNCYECNKICRELFQYCHKYELREACPGCRSRSEAYDFANKWWDREYLPSLGIADEAFAFSKIIRKLSNVRKSKGVRWI